MRSNIGKGYIFSLAATLAFSNVYVFSKGALNDVSLPVFLFLMCSVGFVINLIILFASGGYLKLLSIPKSMWSVFPLLGFLEIFTVITFYAAVNAIPQPAVTGFLGNLFPLFTTFMGIIFLKERFSFVESLGILVVFTGALLTSYSGSLTLTDFFIPGVGLVVLNCLGAATATVIVRAKVNNLSPEILSFNRVFWIFIFVSGWMLMEGTPLTFTKYGFVNSLIAGLLDPVLAILLAYKAYRYIEASRGTIIQSTKGLMIIPIAFLFFGTLPLPHQLAGGIIAMIGVFIIGIGQHVQSIRRKKLNPTVI